MTNAPAPAPAPTDVTQLIVSYAQPIIAAACTALVAVGWLKAVPGGETINAIATFVGVVGNVVVLIWVKTHDTKVQRQKLAIANRAYMIGFKDGGVPNIKADPDVGAVRAMRNIQ